jgi:riboflavin synthase
MFTGIVSELGTVRSVERSDAGARIAIAAALATGLDEGDSVAVEGACLTAATVSADGFEADVMNQTLGLTTLGGLSAGDAVNLEPALRAGDPLGGHIVQGHIDGVGEVTQTVDDGIARRLRIAIPDGLERTTLGAAEEGARVNLELDLVARYVERLLRFSQEGNR